MRCCLYLLIGAVLSSTLTTPADASSGFDFAGFHAPPAWFLSDAHGGFYGATVDGQTFTQVPVNTAGTVRLHRFTLGEQSFYISDLGTFFAQNDLAALSIYMSLQSA